jgi:DNA repair protein RecN (Recombination protein N)
VSTLAEVAEPLVAVHGQSDQHRLLQARAQREALDRFGGAPLAALLTTYADLHRRLEATERELDEVVASARERAQEADLLRFGLGEVEAVAPEPGEDTTLAAEESRLGYADTLRTAAEQAREALSSEQGDPDALATTSAPPKRSSASRWALPWSSRCWSDCPCTATSGSATSASTETGTPAPPT